MELRCFLVTPEQWQAPEIKLSPRESHHLARVLKLAPGSLVEITDGLGRRGRAEVLQVATDGVRLRLLAEIPATKESPLALTLALALCRADIFDLVVRQATELGLRRLVPFFAARSLVQPHHWRPARLERWQRLAREALKSSERSWQPVIEPPVTLPAVLARPEAVKLLFWEGRREDGGSSVSLPEKPAEVLIIIGPEGGFAPAEIAAAQAAGCQLLGLGPRRLRVETAAVAALAIVQHRWGDLAW